MKLLRLLLTVLAVTTLATACGTSSSITAPEIPPHQQNQMGSGNG